MDYARLRDELQQDPLGRGYVAMSAEQAAASLMADDRAVVQPFRVGALGIMREAGPAAGAAILDAIEAASASDSRLKWFLRELNTTGIDLGDPVTRATIDELVSAGVLTPSQGAVLKGAAIRMISRAEELGLGEVRPGDVDTARNY